MRRSTLVLVVVAVLLLALGASAYAVDSSHHDQIADGVRIDGVNVGGMSSAQARAVITRELEPRLQRAVVASAGRQRFVLTAAHAGVRADVATIVGQALERSRGGWFVGRALDTALGRSLDLNLSPRISYSTGAVDHFVAHLDQALDRTPRNASVSFDAGGPQTIREQSGVTVQNVPLREAIAAALGGGGSHAIAVSTSVTRARVTIGQLAAQYPSAIVIDRPAFALRLYDHLRLVHTYPVAIGMQGLETPAGLYHVQEKQVDPPWVVPNSSWAGALAGRTIPPGPQDPIKARWIGFDGSAGIHGTDETSSIGTAGSHGCVRMLIPDVMALYPQVKVGDPVYVA